MLFPPRARTGPLGQCCRTSIAHEKPWFNNQVASLELEGRRATFVLEQAIPPEDGKGEPRLERVFRRPIEPNAVFAGA